MLETAGIDYEEGQHTQELILNAAKVVKSPGIPEKAPIITTLRNAGISIISEIEFAALHTQAKLIAITGSNGKTTTTALTYHLLKAGGFNVGVAGNIGNSFAMELASGNHFDYYVLEVSSFQLDDIVDFHPHIAVITNITPDHLDRYNYSLDKYAAAKFNIARNLTPADYFIYGADSPELVQRLAQYPNKAVPYPFSSQNNQAVIWSDGQLIQLPNQVTIPVAALSLKGKHNLYNAMAAVAVAQILGVPQPNISRALSSFIPPEHRLEPVASINNILFINDSKATNTDAAWYALDAFTQPIIWIVGGVDKGNDYTPLLPLVQSRVKAIVCLGKDNEKIIQTFAPIAPTIVQTQSAEQAVTAAFNLAASGNVVLLSPACASFDLFNNYQDRGQQFKQAVHHLLQITTTHQPTLTQ